MRITYKFEMNLHCLRIEKEISIITQVLIKDVESEA